MGPSIVHKMDGMYLIFYQKYTDIVGYVLIHIMGGDIFNCTMDALFPILFAYE